MPATPMVPREEPRSAREYARDQDGQFARTDSRAERALATYKPSTRAKQLIAAKSERLVAKALGGRDLPDHEPMDILGPGFGVEVKTIIDSDSEKITIHKSSLARKIKWVEEHHVTGHTVVVDRRNNVLRYYYQQGFGSFRVGNMKRVSISELRRIVLGAA